MLPGLLRLIARLPLRGLHAIGAVIGWISYIAAPDYAKRLRDNLQSSALCGDVACNQLIRRAVAEAGKGVMELTMLWFAADHRIQHYARCDTWDVVENIRGRGKGIIFMTPHLGGFELCAQFIAQRMPITVMYRPPKLAWLEPLMIAGRSRWQSKVVPANLKGVRAFLKALQRGEAVGLLPDQTPSAGEGAWADFFGRPAYTMTLVKRLQSATDASLVMVSSERLSGGQGYQLLFEEISSVEFDEQVLNRAVENAVRRFPAQYLWGYNRYKCPAGAPPPPAGART